MASSTTQAVDSRTGAGTTPEGVEGDEDAMAVLQRVGAAVRGGHTHILREVLVDATSASRDALLIAVVRACPAGSLLAADVAQVLLDAVCAGRRSSVQVLLDKASAHLVTAEVLRSVEASVCAWGGALAKQGTPPDAWGLAAVLATLQRRSPPGAFQPYTFSMLVCANAWLGGLQAMATVDPLRPPTLQELHFWLRVALSHSTAGAAETLRVVDWLMEQLAALPGGTGVWCLEIGTLLPAAQLGNVRARHAIFTAFHAMDGAWNAFAPAEKGGAAK